MPVGVTLLNLRRDLRAETGQSLSPAQGVQSQETQDIQLDRQQRELWEQFEWPHLRYWVDVPALKNQSIYSYPNSMPFDQINRIYFAASGNDNWKALQYGLRAFDLSPTTAQVGSPARWGNKVSVDTDGKTNPIGQVELLPVPSSDGILRFEGQAPCNPLVADDDTCVIDSKAIVLFAAAEILATQKAEAAALKLQKANQYLRRLLANQGADKRISYNMGGRYGGDYTARNTARGPVPGIDYVP